MMLYVQPLLDYIPSSPARNFLMYLQEFDKIFMDHTLMEPMFSDGTMLLIKGAAIQSWYADVGKRRKWVRCLNPGQAYAFGIDAFETEVS